MSYSARALKSAAHGILRGLSMAGLMVAASAARAPAQDLKLLISLQQPTITAPFPARVTLHFHNSGTLPIWLYRPVGNPPEGRWADAVAMYATDFGPEATSGGSALQIHLEPASSGAGNSVAGSGLVFESAGLPHPKLFSIAPGGDEEEKTTLVISPAKGEEPPKPIWGRYRLRVTYSAKYSNAESLERILGVDLWQGEVESNTIEFDYAPPPATAKGSVSGTVVSEDGRPMPRALVSLNDQQEVRVSQQIADDQGHFSFTHLPYGTYWVTARRPLTTNDAAVFQHVDLGESSPSGTLQLVMLKQDIYEAKRMLHKPVLILVADSQNHPLAGVDLDIVWSSGTILDETKAKTGEDGIVVTELLPGRNFVTLKRRGCPKDDERADVAPGGGIDGFKLDLDCSKK